jgi:hypothetical protein
MQWSLPFSPLRVGDHAIDAEYDLAKENGEEKNDYALRVTGNAGCDRRSILHRCGVEPAAVTADAEAACLRCDGADCCQP